jgi:hypothetical protein
VPSRFDPLAWHTHEMLFGFVLAAVAGFLLTAIPNWTGRRPLSGAPLTLLAGLWRPDGSRRSKKCCAELVAAAGTNADDHAKVETAELDLRPGDIVFEFPFGRIVDTGMACRSQRPGSLLTPRWREKDSNPRSP